MPGIVRLGDLSTGHGCYPPQAAIEASPDVFVDGIAVVTVDCHWATHCCKSCHDGVSSEGSATVFVNGKPKVRQGDAISCGSHADQCSETVFAG